MQCTVCRQYSDVIQDVENTAKQPEKNVNLCVVAKVCKLGISQHCTESLDDVLAFLGRFLHFASKK